jgi:GAF domain-containing protein
MLSIPVRQTFRPFARKLSNLVFLSFFVLYTGAAIIWLVLGFAPFLAVVFPALRETLWEWGYFGKGPPGFLHDIRLVRVLATTIESASWGIQPPTQVTLQYLFSLLNLVLGIFLVWLRPHNRAAYLLALGMIGTAAIFNLQAHGAREVLPAMDELHSPFHLISGLAYVLGLLFFPNGRFLGGRLRPRWFTWPLRFAGLVLLTFAAYLFNFNDGEPEGLVIIFGVVIPIAGVVAQAMRSRRAQTAEERQQARVLMWALALAFGLAMLFTAILLGLDAVRPDLAGGVWRLRELVFLIFPPLFAVIPVTLFMVILRYRLWDIDLILSRTVVYSALTAGLALVYFGSVILSQALFDTLTAVQSTLVASASALLIAALFQPLRRRLQVFIDRRFYREKVNFRQAFMDFGGEIRTIFDLSDLVRALVERTTGLLHIAHGAVFLRGADGAFQLVSHRGSTVETPNPTALSLNDDNLERLRAGGAVEQPKDKTFPLLIPLRVPRTSGSELLGVLALGPRLSGQRYSSDDRDLLLGLADQAGTAVHVAQLIAEEQAAAQRREESERRMEAHRRSPAGRAETMAQVIVTQPDAAIGALHRLAQAAGQDSATASLLANLPTALANLGAGRIASLAEGFNYLVNSEVAPELLSVGVRSIGAYLENAAFVPGRNPALETAAVEAGAQRDLTACALLVYRLCESALEVGSITQITELLPPLRGRQALTTPICNARTDNARDGDEDRANENDFLTGLASSMAQLQSVADTLHTVERVDATEDKLTYLASAVEGLARVNRHARLDLGAADRPIVQRIAERWLAIITDTMGELQTRARITCELLTRHIWRGDVVSLILILRNSGRGPALEVAATVAPAPEYGVLPAAPTVARLGPGEETQVELKVRPNLEGTQNAFRARFTIHYTDSRGPNQVEHIADTIYMLATNGAWQFIPNPYVVGTPLHTGSPLFFGREDLVGFIQENLQAAHRNNLVLIGQRRTGKTSLLKQVPARLGETYVPVYLDGQMLGLDPGLDNFCLALATEIAFALEDRGLNVAPPQMGELSRGPTIVFERQFLARVREAIGERHLLILLDEFEELEGAVQRGNLPASVFGFLRHLIQHGDNLSVIFCGTHRLEELTADYWTPLFNISLARHVAFLEQPEALRLIQEPVAACGMRYDDLALDKMWRVTFGHPYFLQLLCHSLVNRHNKTRRNDLTVDDVNAALDEILATGEAHFLYLWTESTWAEQLVLTALSRVTPLTGQAGPEAVRDYLGKRGVVLDRRSVSEALHRLALRDILTEAHDGVASEGTADTSYRWKLGLLGMWVEKYRPVARVVEEVQG